MKGTSRRTRIRRHGPGWLILRELEKKGPEAAPVSKEIRAVAAFGKILVVLPFRHGRQQARKASTRLRHHGGANAPKCVPGPYGAIVMSSSRPGKVRSVAQGDHDCPSTTLRHPILGHVEHPVRQPVSRLASIVDVCKLVIHKRERRSPALDEPRDVLNQESPGQKTFDQGHQAPEASPRAFVAHSECAGPGPLSRLREGLAGRSGGQQRELACVHAETVRTQVTGGVVHVMKTELRESGTIECEGASRRGIALDPPDRLESRPLESEVEPSDPGECREVAKWSPAWLQALAVGHARTRSASVHDPGFYRSPVPGLRGCRGRT